MNFVYRLLFKCTLILIYITVVSAIQCYVCNSHIDEDCSKIINEQYLKNCSEPRGGTDYGGCRKMEQWLDTKILDHEPEQRIIRQCAKAPIEDKEKGCIYRSGFASRQNTCHCESTGCNGASIVSLLSLSYVALTFLCAHFLL